ncbi:MAG TPA: vanadium-dependent haloperoxidase [Candidatus Limnocylindrales bacterium]|nr:vanadium-dependent haloperoxidase [Candidatus Limnocylindrales bacterium]
MIRELTKMNLGHFLLVRRRGAGTTICSALLILSVAMLAAGPLPVSAAGPDTVLEWIGVMNTTVLAGGTNPLVTSRVVALVSASVFDAVNGIDPRFQPIHVRPAAPRNASPRAAAIQAAYVILVDLYPAQSATLTAQRDASIAALASTERANSIAAGVAWGQTVADAIWAWRLTDGFAPAPPPFLGVQSIVGTPAAIGAWRPTPQGLPNQLPGLSGAGPQFATMTPWVLRRPSQFRLPPPPGLTSPEYAADLDELFKMGVYSGSGRTQDQSDLALFWAGNTPLFWNRIAAQISVERGLSFTENAHLFALLNVTMADAAIACWDGKYRYVFWRPITAIRDGFTPADSDPAWIPWLDFFPGGTPAHPEYPSGHSTVSGSAAFILAARFGENTAFSLTSETAPGKTRSFVSFSDAVAEIANARVFGGIHFRTSCVRANTLGRAVADYVSRHAMRATGDDEGDKED